MWMLIRLCSAATSLFKPPNLVHFYDIYYNRLENVNIPIQYEYINDIFQMSGQAY